MFADIRELKNGFEDEKTMKPKKVILWGRQDVLGGAVESFLATRDEWEVIRVMDDEPTNTFIEKVETENPDVIIIYEGDHACLTPLPMQLMQSRPELRVITVNLENNSLEIYTKQKVWIKEVADLFLAIEE